MQSEDQKYHDYLNHEVDNPALDREVKQFLDQCASITTPKSVRSKEEIWGEIEQTVEKQEKNRSVALILWPSIAVAAAVALFLIASPVFFGSAETLNYYSEAGETKTITLPHGSQVVLNADSKMKFEEKDGTRKVGL